MAEIFTGNAAYVAGGTSAPMDIVDVYALEGIKLDVTGLLTVGVAGPAVLTADGVLNILRRIELNVAGEQHMGIGLEAVLSGGAFLNMLNRVWFGKLPLINQPAVGVAANPFSFSMVIPFKGSEQLGKNLSRDERLAMCFRRNGRPAQIQFFFGIDTDVAAPAGGGTAVVTANVRVSVIENRTLDQVPSSVGGQDPLNHYHHFTTESLPVAAVVAAAEQHQLRLARGMSPGFLYRAIDNGVPTTGWVNELQLFLNGNNQRYRATEDSILDKTREYSGLQIAPPAGNALVYWDDGRDGLGYLPLGSAEVGSSIVELNHDVSAGGVLRFGLLHMFLA